MSQNSKSTISGRSVFITASIGLAAGAIFALGTQVSGGKAEQEKVVAALVEAPAVIEQPQIAAIPAAGAETANLQRLLARMNTTVPTLNVTDSEIPGLKRVEIAGGPVLFLSADGKYLVEGRLLDISGDEPVDPSQAQRSALAKELIAGVDPSEWIAFGASKPTAHVYVLTDLDCGYCRKLHEDMPMLHTLGIQVRYLAYPRGGEGTSTWTKSQNVWCAKDRNSAFSDAKADKEVPEAVCDSPVAKHYELGQKLGVRGTPTIILENGKIIDGYLPAAELAKAAMANKAK